MLESRAARAAAALVAVVLIVVLFLALSGDEDKGGDDTATPTATAPAKDPAPSVQKERKKPAPGPDPQVPVVAVENGEPAGGVAELAFEKGEAISFVVESDTAEEVHLHGYDVSEDVEAGGRVEFDVPADLEGVYEVELEGSAVPIAEITVEP